MSSLAMPFLSIIYLILSLCYFTNLHFRYRKNNELRNLTHLNLSSCNLPEFPKDISWLNILEWLDISNNPCIQQMPWCFRKCTRLKHLDISHCNLQKISTTSKDESRGIDFFRMAEVQLYIGEHFQELHFLNLHGNKNLKSSDFMLWETHGDLQKEFELEHLDISSCDLTSVPPDVTLCIRLKHLNISANPGITSLPPKLHHLRDLQTLNASHCHLTECPKSIAELPHLESCNIKGNKITVIAEEIILRWASDPSFRRKIMLDEGLILKQPPSQVFNQVCYLTHLQNRHSKSSLGFNDIVFQFTIHMHTFGKGVQIENT